MDRQAWWATVHGVTKSQTHTQPRNESIDPGNHHQWLLIPQKEPGPTHTCLRVELHITFYDILQSKKKTQNLSKPIDMSIWK